MLQPPLTYTILVDYFNCSDKLECRKYFVAAEVYHAVTFYYSLD